MSTISKFKKVKMFSIPFFLKEFLLINVLIGVYVVFCSNEEEKLRKPEREKKVTKGQGNSYLTRSFC